MLSPAYYVLEGAPAVLLEGALMVKLWQYIWPTLLLAVAMVPTGLWIFEQAEQYAQRNGKLARSG